MFYRQLIKYSWRVFIEVLSKYYSALYNDEARDADNSVSDVGSLVVNIPLVTPTIQVQLLVTSVMFFGKC